MDDLPSATKLWYRNERPEVLLMNRNKYNQPPSPYQESYRPAQIPGQYKSNVRTSRLKTSPTSRYLPQKLSRWTLRP